MKINFCVDIRNYDSIILKNKMKKTTKYFLTILVTAVRFSI